MVNDFYFYFTNFFIINEVNISNLSKINKSQYFLFFLAHAEGETSNNASIFENSNIIGT